MWAGRLSGSLDGEGTATPAGLAALLLMIGVTNLFNRLNAPTRQVAGAWS